MKKFISLCLFLLCITQIFSFNTKIVKADSLSDNIDKQMEILDLAELENFINSVCCLPEGTNFSLIIKAMLKGEYNSDFDSVIKYVFRIIISNFNNYSGLFVSVLVVSLLSGLLNNFKGNFLTGGLNDIVFYVCFLAVVLLLGTQTKIFYENSKNAIENIAKIIQIMSPIILTLMIATGGSVSASVYKPAVIFLSNGVVGIVLNVLFPLMGLVGVFSLIESINPSMKLSKFSEGLNGIIKWIIGIVVTIYGLFLTIQGITSASFDGISLRVTKYAISNSIPMIGGFLKDGFDLVIAGSVIIKNAVGIVSIFALFYLILSPVLQMVAFSILLKFLSGITESFGDGRIASVCLSVSKVICYFVICILLVGFMLFLTILLMVFSANAFL